MSPEFGDGRERKVNLTSNSWRVVDSIRAKRIISRRGIIDDTGIAWASVSAATQELLSGGFIRSAGNVSRGKPRQESEAFEVNPDAGYMLGVQVDTSAVTVRLIDLSFNTVSEFSNDSLLQDKSLSGLIRSVQQSLNYTVEQLEQSGKFDKLLAIGFSLPARSGDFRSQSGFDSLRVQHLTEFLNRKTLGRIPIVNDWNSRAASQAELEIGGRDNLPRSEEIFVYYRLDRAVGKGVVMNKKVYKGDGFAGGPEHSNPDGRGMCACRTEDCDVIKLSESAVLSQWQAVSGGRELALEEIAEKANQGDQNAVKIFNEYGAKLGRIVSRDIMLMNPGGIILGGSMSRHFDLFFPHYRQAIDEGSSKFHLEDLRTYPSRLGNDAPALGAAIAAYHNLKV